MRLDFSGASAATRFIAFLFALLAAAALGYWVQSISYTSELALVLSCALTFTANTLIKRRERSVADAAGPFGAIITAARESSPDIGAWWTQRKPPTVFVGGLFYGLMVLALRAALLELMDAFGSLKLLVALVFILGAWFMVIGHVSRDGDISIEKDDDLAELRNVDLSFVRDRAAGVSPDAALESAADGDAFSRLVADAERAGDE